MQNGGLVQLAENVPGLEGMVVADELATRLGRPVVAENDINQRLTGSTTVAKPRLG